MTRRDPTGFGLTHSYDGDTEASFESSWRDRIKGGLADDKKPSHFSHSALSKGRKVEMEHTSDPGFAQEIAMDHLTEDPEYYDKLEKMEGHHGR